MPDAEGAIERLYEDADVRDELRDDEANLLLKWAEDQLTTLAESSATDEEFDAKADQFRGLLKGMNRLVGNRTTLDEAALNTNLAQLSAQATTAAASSGQVSAQALVLMVPDGQLKAVAGQLPSLDDAGAVKTLMALFTPGAVQAQMAAPAIPPTAHEAAHETNRPTLAAVQSPEPVAAKVTSSEIKADTPAETTPRDSQPDSPAVPESTQVPSFDNENNLFHRLSIHFWPTRKKNPPQ